MTSPSPSGLSSVVRSVRHWSGADGRDYFLGALLTVFVVSEILGPLIGWPTLTGRLYALLGIPWMPAREGSRILWFLLFALIPQVAATLYAGRAVVRTSWLAWLHSMWRRLVQKQIVVLPEARLLETSLGLVAGVVVTALVDVLLGDLPPARGALMGAEAVVLALCVVTCAAYIALRPKTYFQIVDDENTVVQQVPAYAQPLEIGLDATAFAKTIALRRTGAQYEWCDAQAPIRLDRGAVLLVNLGVLERQINAPVTVTSANAFMCSGRFGLHIGRPQDGVAPFDARGVQLLVDNLYARGDLEHMLTESLSIVINDYAKEADAHAFELVEKFRMEMLGTYHGGATDAHRPEALRVAAGGLNTVQIAQDRFNLVSARTAARLAKLEEYRTTWKDVRKLQQRATRDLPDLFNRGLLTFLTARAGPGTPAGAAGPNAEPAASLGRLYDITRVVFRIDSFEFTAKAQAAENLVNAEIEKAHQELAAAEEQLGADRQAREKEIRDLIDAKINPIDARMMSTPRGRLLFEQLMKLRMSDRETLLSAPVLETLAKLGVGVEDEEPPSGALQPPT